MTNSWKHALDRWTAAALIDAATAERIRAFEEQRGGTSRLRLPVLIALAFGGLMLGAGVLLFVSAHWDMMSPAARFGLVLSVVAAFHAAAASLADRSVWVSSTLSALGTVALGAGVFLTGQIFHLDAHWPAGLLLWAAGAAVGWVLLRDVPHVAFVAMLVPAWLAGEWRKATGLAFWRYGQPLEAAGMFLLLLAYFTAAHEDEPAPARRTLRWIGGVCLPFAAIALAVSTGSTGLVPPPAAVPSQTMLGFGWVAALALPLLLAILISKTPPWPLGLAALWIVGEFIIQSHAHPWALYGWWAAGAIGLAAWGVRDGRSERVNMASAMFAGTVLTFYFSQVMDKLGRSASLIGLGILFLAGGWAVEQTRRRLIRTSRGEQS